MTDRTNTQSMKNNDNNIEQLQDNINEITENLKALFIEQEKLYKAIKKENKKKTNSPESTKKHNKRNNGTLPIGTKVQVTSNHKNRKGTIGTITGYRGTTQYLVTTASSHAEAEAQERFSVWKPNVRALE